MNRKEALRILGLDEDATLKDVKVAYRETVQILHPDRFAGNQKLQDRATEQFKTLQEAYECLTKNKGGRGFSEDDEEEGPSRVYSSASQTSARMAGITAARIQLVKQRDVVLDERRNGITMAFLGGLIALICGRRPFGLFGLIAGISSAVAIWGVVQVVSSQRSLNTLDEHIDKLRKEERRLAQELDDEE